MSDIPGYDAWKLQNDRDADPQPEDGGPQDAEPDARDLFNMLDSDGAHACPDCGSRQTHPTPGCSCPPMKTKFGMVTRHINRYHHTCGPSQHEAIHGSDFGAQI